MSDETTTTGYSRYEQPDVLAHTRDQCAECGHYHSPCANEQISRLRERVAELERRVWQPATGHWLVTVGDGVTSYTCVGEIEDPDEARLRVAIQRAEGDAVTALRGLRARQTGYSLADEFRAVADAVAKHAALAQAGAVEVR